MQLTSVPSELLSGVNHNKITVQHQYGVKTYTKPLQCLLKYQKCGNIQTCLFYKNAVKE